MKNLLVSIFRATFGLRKPVQSETPLPPAIRTADVIQMDRFADRRKGPPDRRAPPNGATVAINPQVYYVEVERRRAARRAAEEAGVIRKEFDIGNPYEDLKKD